MKTLVKIYSNGNLKSFNPSVEVSASEVYNETSNEDVKRYALAVIDYSDFCDNQTASGQKRKNQRYKARKRIFANLSDIDYNNYLVELRKLQKQFVEKLSYETIELTFDGRKKQNISKYMQAIELDINVGGVSPQYYGIGLKSYKFVK